MPNTLNESTVNQIHALDEIADKVAIKSDAEIERLITETEETLSALMDELKRRQMDKQHKDIDNLEAHLHNAHINFKALREFMMMALKEIGGKR